MVTAADQLNFSDTQRHSKLFWPEPDQNSISSTNIFSASPLLEDVGNNCRQQKEAFVENLEKWKRNLGWFPNDPNLEEFLRLYPRNLESTIYDNL